MEDNTVCATVEVRAHVQEELKGKDVYLTFYNDIYEITCILKRGEEYTAHQRLALGEYSMAGGVCEDIRSEYQCNTGIRNLILFKENEGAGVDIYIGTPEWVSEQSEKIEPKEMVSMKDLTEEEAKAVESQTQTEWSDLKNIKKDTKEQKNLKYETVDGAIQDTWNNQVLGIVIFVFLLGAIAFRRIWKRKIPPA